MEEKAFAEKVTSDLRFAGCVTEGLMQRPTALRHLWLLFTKPKVESLIISSTQRQSMIMFDYCYFTIMANPLMREMIQRPGTTRTIIRLKSPLGGRLVALPCSPDKLRGYHPDWGFIDEASIVPSEMITGEIMMMLTKPNAGLVMSGTPMGFDHVFRKPSSTENATTYITIRVT